MGPPSATVAVIGLLLGACGGQAAQPVEVADTSGGTETRTDDDDLQDVRPCGSEFIQDLPPASVVTAAVKDGKTYGAIDPDELLSRLAEGRNPITDEPLPEAYLASEARRGQMQQYEEARSVHGSRPAERRQTDEEAGAVTIEFDGNVIALREVAERWFVTRSVLMAPMDVCRERQERAEEPQPPEDGDTNG